MHLDYTQIKCKLSFPSNMHTLVVNYITRTLPLSTAYCHHQSHGIPSNTYWAHGELLEVIF